MKIQTVRIKNFRALKDVTITFDSVTTFIGPNGCGKSTVLRALDWFFNGVSKSGDLTDEDCSFGAKDEVIEVQVTFDKLTDADRGKLKKYAPVEAPAFTAWKRRTPDGEEMLSANAKGFPAFTEIKSAENATTRKERYNDLRKAQSELNLPAWSNEKAALAAIAAWESSNQEILDDVPEDLRTNFFGFNSEGKMDALFDFVFISADLRAGEQAQDAKTSVIGRILERSVDRKAADDGVTEIVEESRAALRKLHEDKFQPQLDSIMDRLNSVIANYSPGRSLTVSPSDFELKAPTARFAVSVMDGDVETAVERQGHGFQRTLLISALQVLAQSGAASADGVICLAIEEPELFQHPIQAQAFAKVMRTLVDDSSKQMQVTYATHSPYFVEAQHFHQVRRLVRSADETPVVTIHSATIVDVQAKLRDVEEVPSPARKLDELVADQLPVALFAASAFLVEGATDSAVFRGIGDRKFDGGLESMGIAVVAAGGKNNITLVHAILDSLKIPTYTLFDGDNSHRGSDAEKAQSTIRRNRNILKYFNLDEVDFPESQVGGKVAIFEDNLEALLDSKWSEWRVSYEEFALNMNINPRKYPQAYRIVTRKALGNVPYLLAQILAKLEGL